MGNCFSPIPARLVCLGMDAVGKTTILYQMHLKKPVHTIPTVGFNVESFDHKNHTFTMYDVGGGDKICPLWWHFYQGADAIVMVLDSNDRKRMDCGKHDYSRCCVKGNLECLTSDKRLDGVPILIMAHKHDRADSMKQAEILQRIGVEQLRGRPWYIETSATSDWDGLYRGFDWLSHVLLQPRRPVTLEKTPSL